MRPSLGSSDLYAMMGRRERRDRGLRLQRKQAIYRYLRKSRIHTAGQVQLGTPETMAIVG